MKLLIFSLMIARAFACQVIEGDRILGKDLAAASPLFASIDPKLEIGAAPLAGARRVIRSEELMRLARQNAIAVSAPLSELCFELTAEPLTVEKLLPVLRQSLEVDGASIEIIEFSRSPLPRGTLEFTRAGLSASGLWRGRVIYSEGRSAPVWVKTHITVTRTWIEPSEALASGKPITSSQLMVKTGPRFPFESALAASIDQVAGRRPVRTLMPGTAILSSMLLSPHDVERGDKVAVEVTAGAAVLSFAATAESSGSVGEQIIVRNPDNGHRFQARIQTKGRVLVEK